MPEKEPELELFFQGLKKISPSKKVITIVAIILVILGPISYFGRPLFHGLFIFFYKSPSFLILLILLFVGYGVLRLVSKLKGEELGRKVLILLSVIGMVYLIGAVYASAVQPKIYLGKNLDYKEISELPIVSAENIRITPEPIADYYARVSLQYPRYRMGGTDLVYANGELIWSAPIVPDGLINVFRLQNRGMLTVNAMTVEKKITEIEKTFEFGEGVLLSDSIWWRVYSEDYWIDIGDWYFLPAGDSTGIVIPAIAYEHRLWGIWPYTIPVFKGVYEVDPEGNLGFYGREDILGGNIPSYLNANRLYPEGLVRIYAEAYSWRLGLGNILFYHENQLDIKDPTIASKQPFLIMTDEGLRWIVVAEPSGEAYGISRIFLFDAQTGEINVQVLTKPLLGPIRSIGVLESAYPVTAFNRISLEPLPVIQADKLYWRIVVSPMELSSIAYVGLVDAVTNEVYRFDTDEEFYAFFAGAPPSPPPSDVFQQLREEIQELRESLTESMEKLERLENLLVGLEENVG